jgi:ATP-dependent Clp protease adaptor protein ClpS
MENVLKINLDENRMNPIFGESEEEGGVATVTKKKVKRPQLYQVFLHNDDYTTMEFVVFVLQTFFKKDMEQAQRIMLKVHTEGKGVCGVYTCEIAETKVAQVLEEAKEQGHPLQCSSEPV